MADAVPKFRVSKLPVVSKEVFKSYTDRTLKNELSQNKIVLQRKRIRDAIVASNSEQTIMIKKRSSPERYTTLTIGDTLSDAVKRDIRLPFI